MLDMIQYKILRKKRIYKIMNIIKNKFISKNIIN